MSSENSELTSEVVGDVYRVQVDYSLEQGKMLRESGHVWNGVCAREGIHPEFLNRFPEEGLKSVELKLHRFHGVVCVSYVRLHFVSQSLTPADYWMLCSLIKKFPVVKTFGHVVGLGSVFRRPPKKKLPTSGVDCWFPYSERQDGAEGNSMTLCESAECLEGEVVYATACLI